ncbi:MAG: cytochrome C [Bacteroidota bacterium]
MLLSSLVVSFLLLAPVVAFSQISPGDLSRGHASLEGVENCTKCHTIGKTLSNDRCLGCHSEISVRMQARKGFHATVIGKQCAECHSEHHGRDFQIVHFDRRTFDHRTTGYPLLGKHAGVQCDSCHVNSRVTAADILKLLPKRHTTYLGLASTCLSCHVDQHRGQFTETCNQCHTENGWKPATKFSHDRTRFPLTGRHVKVECASCHNRKVENTQAVLYRGLAFSTCESCHADPHHGSFQKACTGCHSTESWTRVGKVEFDHGRTRFPLRGAHARLACESCHARSNRARNASGEFGFHITRFQACADCHADAHAGQFASRPDKGRCETCHTEQSFTPVTYTVDDHNRSSFPLTGAHLATPCTACHVANAVKAKSTRRFRWDGTPTCRTCHKDPHGGQFAARSGSCESCHTTSAWKNLLFDHAKTNFPLEGKHAAVPCEKCHVKATPVRYVGVATACASCHEEPHAGQFAANGTTRCEPCHTAVSWKNITLNHSKTRFPLTGQHESVPCAQCHKQERINNKNVVRYRPLGIACEDCHAPGSTGDAKMH